MKCSLLFVFVKLPRDDFDKLSLSDYKLLFDSILLFDGLVIGPKYQLFDLLLSEILL